MAFVFLSSTLPEMHEYREAAISVIEEMGHRCIRMEEFPEDDQASPLFRMGEVVRCDLFVLLLDQLYGPMIPNTDISCAQVEFTAAAGKPRLACVALPIALSEIRPARNMSKFETVMFERDKRRQSEFVNKATRGLLPVFFMNAGQLRMWLGMQIADHFRALSPTPAAGESETKNVLPLFSGRAKRSKVQSARKKAPTPGQIFISYASPDRPKIKPLVAALEQAGWSVWWDRTIPPGKIYDDVIEQALDRAECVIVVWSEQSVGSQWVRNEAEEARNRGILVPVLLEEVKVPLAFRRIQAARLIDWKGESDEPGFQELCQAITRTITNS